MATVIPEAAHQALQHTVSLGGVGVTGTGSAGSGSSFADHPDSNLIIFNASRTHLHVNEQQASYRCLDPLLQ